MVGAFVTLTEIGYSLSGLVAAAKIAHRARTPHALGGNDRDDGPRKKPCHVRSTLKLLTAPPPQLFFTGKDGVGKTTVAAACAIGLVGRGLQVHLSTTDPAAHLVMTLAGDALPGLRVDRIDPKVETERYVERIMTTRGRDLDEQGAALLREDLRSPCTEEVAVFHAFSRIVAEARSASSSCPGRQARLPGCPRYGAWLADFMQSVPATHRKAAPGR